MLDRYSFFFQAEKVKEKKQNMRIVNRSSFSPHTVDETLEETNLDIDEPPIDADLTPTPSLLPRSRSEIPLFIFVGIMLIAGLTIMIFTITKAANN